MSELHISLAAEPLFTVGGLTVTNAMLTGVLGSIIIAVIVIAGARRARVKPGGRWNQIVEGASELLLDTIDRVTLDRQKSLSYFPLLATLFIFIVANNWLGLLPGVGSITWNTHGHTYPLLRAATADLNTTLALAAISVVMTQVYAIRRLGLFSHLSKYFSLNPIMLFVGILEIVSEFSKMISFSFRLFGNIFAGEVLLVVISFLSPAIAPLPFFALELFVGFVQGLVFTTLTLVFLEIASAHHGDHGDGEEHAAVSEAEHSTLEPSSRVDVTTAQV